MRGGWYSYEAKYTKNIPIVLGEKGNEHSYNEIIRLVEVMIQLQIEKQQTNTPDKLNQLEARIKYTDDKIDQLVFNLHRKMQLSPSPALYVHSSGGYYESGVQGIYEVNNIMEVLQMELANGNKINWDAESLSGDSAEKI